MENIRKKYKENHGLRRKHNNKQTLGPQYSFWELQLVGLC
jgi:hypothetical protein